MTTWTSDELNRIGAAEELEIASLRRRRHAAKTGDDLGRPPRRRPLCPIRQGARQRLVPRHAGAPRGTYPGRRRGERCHLRGGNRLRINDQIDAAYVTKYRRYAASIAKSMVTPEARAATIKLVPR